MTPLQSLIYEKAASTINAKDFAARYKKYLKQGMSKRDAYYATEKDHIEITGSRRYKDIVNFQRASYQMRLRAKKNKF